MDKLAALLATVVPGVLAITVVVGWIVATVANVAGTTELRDAAIAVLAFYFGGVIHGQGVATGANAANGITAK
jgi:hypothetical protein